MKSTMQYKGNVTLSIKSLPSKKTSNSGTNKFFNVLHSILSQTLPQPDRQEFTINLPAYITIVKDNYDDEGKNLTQIYLKSPDSDYLFTNLIGGTPNKNSYTVILSNMPIVTRDATHEKVTFSCVLNNSNILQEADLSGQGTYLLLDGTNNNILAYSSFDLSNLQPIKDQIQGQGRITWEMSIGNVDTTE